MNPISILIITNGKLDFVKKCVHSIKNQISLRDEIIVISSKRLPIYDTSVSVYTQNEKQKSQGAARNLAMEKAKHAWIAFIDDDCTPDRNWLNEVRKSTRTNHSFIHGQVSHPPNESIWSLLENISLHVYKTIPDRHVWDRTIGIKLITKNLVINTKKIPFRPLFLPNSTNYQEDQLLLLKLNMWGIQPDYNDSMIVYHHPASTSVDYVTKQFIEGRTQFWKKYTEAKRIIFLKTIFGPVSFTPPEHKKKFNIIMQNARRTYVDKSITETPIRIIFRLSWKLKIIPYAIGFLYERLLLLLRQNYRIRTYLLPNE